MTIFEDYGNMISASIPVALFEAIKQKKVQRGNKILLLGTSAGLSIGASFLNTKKTVLITGHVHQQLCIYADCFITLDIPLLLQIVFLIR